MSNERWLEVHRGLEHYGGPTAWFYVTACRQCIALAEKLDRVAMSSDLYVQRGKVLLAFGQAHHSTMFVNFREWVLVHELRERGWPDEVIRQITELVFDAELELGGDQIPIIVREELRGHDAETNRARRDTGILGQHQARATS